VKREDVTCELGDVVTDLKTFSVPTFNANPLP